MLAKMLRRGVRTFLETKYTVIKNTNLPLGLQLAHDIQRQGFAVETIFDIGANIGQMANYFQREFPQSKVYSFEPMAATYQKLNAFASTHPRVQAFPIAFGSQKKEETVHHQKSSVLNSLNPKINRPEKGTGETEKIQIERLDNFCDEKGVSNIDILKTDTEGFDLEVLRGADSILKNKRVRYIICEVGFDPNDIRYTNFFDLHKMIQPFGFSLLGFYHQTVHPQSTHLNFCDALFTLDS